MTEEQMDELVERISRNMYNIALTTGWTIIQMSGEQAPVMAVIQGMMTSKTFNEIEIDAMKLAGYLGISPEDEDGLNLVAKVVHNACRSSGKSYISLGVEDCRRLLAWMDR